MTATIERVLDNGLQVILRPVHVAPVLSTWIWYRVGSRNEVEGQTGLSHWVEHMLFKGSGHFPKGSIMRAVDRHGGYINAMTSYDFTAYYMTLPSQQHELALRIEADRMTSATFDSAEVEAERGVIIAEREGSENEPRYVLAEEMSAVAFRIHPYHHQTIGWKEDLQRITRDALYEHYCRYYMPNNAVLVLVGDLDLEAMWEAVKRHFGDLSPGELPDAAVRPEPPQRGEKRVTLRMPGSAPMVRICYHAPPVSHPDYMPLVVLDAILSGGKAMFAFGNSQARSARLYRALVETEKAAAVGSHYHPSLDPYLFTLGATVRDGHTPEEVEEALLVEVRRAQEEPVQEEELRVAIRQTQAQFAYSSESVTSQALTLGFLEMVDRHERMEHILEELAAVTPEEVQRVARTYLVADNRVTGWFLPTGGGAGGGEAAGAQNYWTLPWRAAWGFSGSHPLMINSESVTRCELDNGVILLAKENSASPSVAIEGNLLAGSLFESDETAGLANLTAAMLRRGTHKHTFQELNVALDNVGASLNFSAGRDKMGFSGQALADDFDLLIALLAEMLMQPSFPEEELHKLRGQYLTHLGVLENDTGYRADQAFMAALYPAGHPYAWPLVGTRETVAALDREAVWRFYRRCYHPRTLVISVVGAVAAERVVDKIAATLGQWQVETPPPVWKVPAVQTPPRVVTERVMVPGKAQVDLVLGVIGPTRASSDYYAAAMADVILGRLGLMGRLGAEVRDSRGLAYYVSSSLHSSRGPHPWNVVAGVHPQNVTPAVDAILGQINRLREELVAEDEYEDCRSYLAGSLPLHLETNAGIADFMLHIEEHKLGLDYLQRYSAILAGVSREDIRAVVRKYLTTDRYVLAMAGTFDSAGTAT